MIIAHRALLNGPNKELENTYDNILKCLDNNLSVEIDLWFKDGKFWIGHDAPERDFNREIQWLYYRIKPTIVFIHAKNIEAMNELLKFKTNIPNNPFDYFLHDKDDAVLTRSGYIWTYPGKELFKNSIAVMPELCFDKYRKKVEELYLSKQIAGVCTDFPLKWKKIKEIRDESQI